jgi:peptide/nickel transport system substrate-binding protein
MFESAEKIDDLTVRMKSKYAIPTMAVSLTLFFVVPPKYWNEVGAEAYGRNPIGTGPFVLDSWVRDSKVVMKANPGYWGEAPAGIEQLVFRPVPDDTVRAAGAMTGEIDIAKNMAISSLPELEMQPNLSVLAVDSYSIFTVIMSALEEHDSPFKDVRVRKAMQFAIDKDAIREHILFDKVVPLNGQVLRKTQLGYNPALSDYPYDPAKARQLLAEAGFPNGFETEFKFPVGRYAQGQEVVEAIVGMLADVGVKAKIVAIEPGEYLRQLRAREFTALALSGSAPPDDPHFFLSQYHSTWRYAYMRNAELDKLIDAGKMELNPDKRAEIYREAVALMYELSPSIYLYGGVDFFAVSDRVKNFAARGDGRFFFYGVSLTD